MDLISIQYRQMIKDISKNVYNKTLDLSSPSQITTELIYDIEQDLWLELYIIKKAKPRMPDNQIEKHLVESIFRLSSFPDLNIVYQKKIETKF